MATDDEVGLLEEQYAWKREKQKTEHHGTRPGSTVARLTSVVWFICPFVTFFLGIAIGTYRTGRLDDFCLKRTSIPSPLSADVKVSYHKKNFNSTLFGRSIYRQKPSPEVDQAWIDIGVYRELDPSRPDRLGVVLIDEENALRSGITRGHVKTPSKDGGKYFVNVEAFHHLHCLNLLRKTNHWNYDYYQNLGAYEFKNEEHFLQLHADHCLDSLREQLMCTADIGVLPYVRIKGQDRAYPDFPAAPHMCRNFEDIRSWVVDAQVAGLEPKLLHNVEPGDIVLDEIP